MIGLVRRWAVDWLASGDASVCDDIMAPDYRLVIGSAVLEGRDTYVAGTVGQLRNYPGLCLTVHDVVLSGDLAAVRFTEHGSAVHRGGAHAAWSGIAIHERSRDRLLRTWAEEDYFSRQRQVADGVPDSIEPPAVAPWNVASGEADIAAEAAVRAWLASGVDSSESVRFNEQWREHSSISIGPVQPEVLFSSGKAVAFHGKTAEDGGYAMGVAGIARVEQDGTIAAHLVTDRSGVASARRRGREGATH